ncbi:MAG TPA: TonB-dependent receptor [Thauera sp.]|nr:TonB-dependent receptor [Thauera sp.]
MKLKPRLLALALALTPLPALSTPPDPAGITPDADLFELSLEQLMDVVVTSVSKRSQPLSSTAAAVHVISAEDIRRSGAANLPEALRLAPGVHVARFSNNRWSVSIRGFGGRYANKLLVLQDGRSLYSPVYSGVFWEFNDIPLELVERIEVVRGPGASIWGANAVNGVINIITRNAADARGTQLSASAGTTLRGSLFASHGVALSEGTHLEVHAKSQYVEPSSTTEAGPARDFWRTRQAGFRLDGKSGADTFRLQGSARDSVAGDHFMQRTADIDAAARDYNSVSELAYLLGRWEHDAGDGTLHSLQAYAEKSRLDILVGSERRSTFDIEYQQQQRLGARVDFVWGGGWRHTRDEILGDTEGRYVRIDNTRDQADLFSLFAQGEFALVPERWALILGARADLRDDAKLAFQPNARVLFTPDKTHSLWASLARGVRTASRAEQSVSGTLPAAPLPYPIPMPPLGTATDFVTQLDGNPGFGHEYLDALDLGWRAAWSPALSTEVAAYHYRYDDLRHARPSGNPEPIFARPPYLAQPVQLGTTEQARVSGVEFSAHWRPTDAWDLAASLALNHMGHSSVDRRSEFSEGTPERIFTLRTGYAISPALQWDAWLRHSSALYTYSFQAGRQIDPHWTLDMRLGWKASRDLEISIVGQNLLDRRHLEAINEPLPSILTEIERGVYLRADWRL